MEVPCWGRFRGDCNPLDTLLGSGTKLVDFPKFASLRCLVSLPFRADGVDILDVLASGVPADFRPPNRSAFQPQVRSTSIKTSLCLMEALP